MAVSYVTKLHYGWTGLTPEIAQKYCEPRYFSNQKQLAEFLEMHASVLSRESIAKANSAYIPARLEAMKTIALERATYYYKAARNKANGKYGGYLINPRSNISEIIGLRAGKRGDFYGNPETKDWSIFIHHSQFMHDFTISNFLEYVFRCEAFNSLPLEERIKSLKIEPQVIDENIPAWAQDEPAPTPVPVHESTPVPVHESTPVPVHESTPVPHLSRPERRRLKRLAKQARRQIAIDNATNATKAANEAVNLAAQAALKKSIEVTKYVYIQPYQSYNKWREYLREGNKRRELIN